MAIRTLMKHQSDAIAFNLNHVHPAFFMEMRLGKTLAYIRWVQLHSDVRAVLVVAPLTVLGDAWSKELAREGEWFHSVFETKGTNQRVAKICTVFDDDNLFTEFAEYGVGGGCGTREWVLIHYEALRFMPDVLKLPWDAIVLDESTKIKDPRTITSKMLINNTVHIRHRSVLSGLPAPESELDLFPQFQFLHGEFMGCRNYWQFRSKYFEPNWAGEWVPKNGVRNAIKAAMHEKAYVLRRADVKIGSKKIYSIRKCKLSDDILKYYKKVEREFATEDNATQWAIVLNTWLGRIAGGFSPGGKCQHVDAEADAYGNPSEEAIPIKLIHTVKIKELLYLLQGDLRDENVVIWFKFNAELQACATALREAIGRDEPDRVYELYGDTPHIERPKILNRFNLGRRQRLFAQIKCAKYGVDASSADTEIYYSNGYSLEDREQSEERILHPKKITPLLVIDLVCEGTVDEDIVSTLRDKSVNAKTFMFKMREKAMERILKTHEYTRDGRS